MAQSSQNFIVGIQAAAGSSITQRSSTPSRLPQRQAQTSLRPSSPLTRLRPPSSLLHPPSSYSDMPIPSISKGHPSSQNATPKRKVKTLVDYFIAQAAQNVMKKIEANPLQKPHSSPTAQSPSLQAQTK